MAQFKSTFRSNSACSVGFRVTYRKYALFASSKILFASSSRSPLCEPSNPRERHFDLLLVGLPIDQLPLPKLFGDSAVEFVHISLIHAAAHGGESLF